MSIQAVAWVLKLKVGNPTLKMVLISIANYADEEGRCWPSTKRIAEDTELTKRSILTALKTLEDKGFITRTERKRPDGSRGTDIIELNRNVGGENFSPRGESDDMGVVKELHQGGEGASPLTTFEPSPEPSVEPSKEERAGALRPSDFEEFWELYPHKVGKQAARASFERICRRKTDKVSTGDLMEGLRRYVAKTDDRPWCNPATWLNQGRWDDMPAVVVPFPKAGVAPANPDQSRNRVLEILAARKAAQ